MFGHQPLLVHLCVSECMCVRAPVSILLGA